MAKFGPETFVSRAGQQYEFRSLNANDVDAYIAVRQKSAKESTHTLQYEGQPRPDMTELALRLAMEEDSPWYFNLGAFYDQKLVAHLGVRNTRSHHPWIKHVGYFGMMVLKSHWGQGLGRAMIKRGLEFCERAGITKLEGEVRTTNYRAQWLYLSEGFMFEGLREDAALIKEQMHDEYYLGWHQKKNLPTTNFKCESERLIAQPLWKVHPTEMAAYQQRNKEHLTPYGPTPPTGFCTEEYWWEQRVNALASFYADQSVRWVLCPIDTPDEVIGTISFSGIMRGPFHTCYCGFGIDSNWQGRGFMTEALKLTCDYMFRQRGLHRIMANYLPKNYASARVLQKVGFIADGHATHDLHIAGEWQPHISCSLVASSLGTTENGPLLEP